MSQTRPTSPTWPDAQRIAAYSSDPPVVDECDPG